MGDRPVSLTMRRHFNIVIMMIRDQTQTTKKIRNYEIKKNLFFLNLL
jgi:hypothetical protein